MDDKPKDFLDEIFTRALSGRSLYKNRNALRSDYIPSKLPFREKQIVSVGESLAPLLHGSKCSNLLIYGKTGTGKTAVTKYVLTRLEEKASKEGLKLKFAYSNTRIAGTEYRILSDIAHSIGLSIPFTGLAISEVFGRIKSTINSSALKMVLVMDEIDFLVRNYGDDLLYELTRANEQLPQGYLSIIGISNDLKFKEFLDPRVLSSLSEEEIVFPPYTAEELRAILYDRAKIAFFEDAITEASINLCAALAGSEHGDARRALDLLRVSGEVAEREGATRVEEKHVRIAVQKIEQDRMVEALRSLPLHAKLLLWSIVSSGEANSTGEVYDRYSNICRKIGVELLTQRRVSMLLSELDLLGLVATNLVSKGRYGRTKKISPSVQLQFVREVFSEDPIISSVL
ncbi:MAG: orc1/cdc6 family replication initiation protein [archaeon]|nr:orc1/cdc6 family replication initiation protein [archaeon]